MKVDTISAYVFRADLWCGPCVVISLTEDWDNLGIRDKVQDPELSAERALDMLAVEIGIDRGVEYEFDSDEFPKVAFRDFMREGDECARCGEKFHV